MNSSLNANLRFSAGTACARFFGSTLLILFFGRMSTLSDFGLVGYALTLAALVATLCDFGFDALVVREIASKRTSRRAAISALVPVKIALGFAGCVLMLLYGAGTRSQSSLLPVGLLCIAATIESISILITSGAKAEDDFSMEFGYVLVQSAIFGAGIFLCVAAFGATPLSFSISYCAGRIGGAAVALRMGSAAHPWRSLVARIDLRKVCLSFRSAAPLTIDVVFGVLYTTADTFIVAQYRSAEELGLYQGAIRVVALVAPVSSVLVTVFYPRICKEIASGADTRPRSRSAHILSTTLLFASVSLFAILFMFSDSIVRTVYGQHMASSGAVLRILAALVPLRFLGLVYSTLMVALRRHRQIAFATIAATAINIAVSLLLIGDHGIVGAALGSIAASGFVAVYYGWIVRGAMGSLLISPRVLLRANRWRIPVHN